jgi:hypothetical protein
MFQIHTMLTLCDKKVDYGKIICIQRPENYGHSLDTR